MGAVHRSTAHCIDHILAVAQLQIGSLAAGSATPDFSQLEGWTCNSCSGAKIRAILRAEQCVRRMQSNAQIAAICQAVPRQRTLRQRAEFSGLALH